MGSEKAGHIGLRSLSLSYEFHGFLSLLRLERSPSPTNRMRKVVKGKAETHMGTKCRMSGKSWPADENREVFSKCAPPHQCNQTGWQG